MVTKAKKRQKSIKASTKWLGYAMVINCIIWINILFYSNFVKGDIDACTNLTKYSLVIGTTLLLGRKAISELIVRFFGKVVTK